MTKLKSAKRKRKAQAHGETKVAKVLSTITPPPDSNYGSLPGPKRLESVISDEELSITIDTLKELAQYPSIIKSKTCKDLRVAVYDFRMACTTGANTAGTCLLSP
jgi:hypothetical protein